MSTHSPTPPTAHPYDADPDHPWARRWRIPRVHTMSPRWQYEAALCVPHLDGSSLWGATEPTEREAQIIGWYITYRCSYYGASWLAKMRVRPFDIDDGSNTVTLLRTAAGWKYTRATFITAPVPFDNDPDQALYPPTPDGLLALLERMNHGTRWTHWTQQNPLPELASDNSQRG